LKARILAAPDASSAVRERARRDEPRFLDDAGLAVAGSKDPEADLEAAARALIEGRPEDAERRAFGVASTSKELAAEAFTLAGAAARTGGDEARARRMEARAFVAACPNDCGPAAVEPPRDDRFAAALVHPGLVPLSPPCIERTGGAGTALTADGAFIAETVDRGAVLRALPTRTWFRALDVSASPEGTAFTACFSSGGRAALLYVDGTPGTLRLGAGASNSTPRVPVPTGFHADRNTVFLAPDGVAWIGDRLDDGVPPDWYLARPADRAAKLVLRSNQARVLAALPGGDLLGYEGDVRTQSGPRPLVRFDHETGKVVRRLGKASFDGYPCATTSDGGALVCARSVETVAVDLGGSAPTDRLVEHVVRDVARPLGVMGGASDPRLLYEDAHGDRWIAELHGDRRTPAPRLLQRGLDQARASLSRSHLLVATPERLFVIGLFTGALTTVPGDFGKTHAALSDDGRWLALGDETDVSVYDVKDASHAAQVWTKHLAAGVAGDGSGRALSFQADRNVLVLRARSWPFAPKAAWSVEDGREVTLAEEAAPPPAPAAPSCSTRYSARITGLHGVALAQCDARILRADGSGSAPVVELSLEDGRPHLDDWDEETGLLVLTTPGAIHLVHLTGARETGRATLLLGERSGAFVKAKDGRYALLGEAALLRDAARCEGGLPLRVCADRWEDPQLLKHLEQGGDHDP
jgi:hypothetical protein